MEVTLAGRMGGPETGTRCLAGVVQTRSRLKSALAPLTVTGLEALHIDLALGGSISDYSPGGIQATARYLAKKHTLNVLVCVPRAAVEAAADAGMPSAILAWLVHGLDTMTLSAPARALDLETVRSALRAAP